MSEVPVAFVKGEAVARETAIAAAQRLLARARLPVIAGLDTDVAGIRAALRLAEKFGGVLDHTGSLAELNVMRTNGTLAITPFEARRVCDLFLLLGPDLPEMRSGVPHLRLSGPSLSTDLAIVRALAAGRHISKSPKKLEAICTQIQKAKFGAAVWRAGSLAEPVVEMAAGLVRDLNATARFSSIILPTHGSGADQVLGWLTGFPSRTGLARGFAEHDPWIFDAKRLVESGETDLVVWISPSSPPWRRAVDTIAITTPEHRLKSAAIHLIAATPGRDHDAELWSAETGNFVHHPATAPSDAPSVATLLEQLA
jgi:formylmethanofuran dehydrogenase subunit B